MTTSYIIGFATKFYTLWSVSDEPYTNQYGEQIGVTHRYAFIKKISTSLERARALFPDTPVDESLRGHRSFNRFESFRPPILRFCRMQCDVFPASKRQEIIESR